MSDALACAIRLLARREHSLAELENKLNKKGYPEDEIQSALARCQRDGLQSDARFAESLTRTRVMQGYGPIKIRQELQIKQVSRDLIDEVLHSECEHWLTHARRVWEKKFSSSVATSFAERQKQKQFLLYRGFSMDTINQL